MKRKYFILLATCWLLSGCGINGNTEEKVDAVTQEKVEVSHAEEKADESIVDDAIEGENPPVVEESDVAVEEENDSVADDVDAIAEEDDSVVEDVEECLDNNDKSILEECDGFTQEIIDRLKSFVAPATNGETQTFQDFDQVLNSDYLGLWYDPELEEAIWIKEEGAYVYIPYLELYGDQLYEWKMLDRKQKGLCPELAIYYNEDETAILAYYVGGITDDYFWCVSQGQVFYKIN